MLIGSPGTKKSSAIKIGSMLLKQAGYRTFAAKKTRQEKFLCDLAEQSTLKDIAGGGEQYSDILDRNLFGEDDLDEADNYLDKPPSECYIDADEFNNFIGLNNLDFVSILGELWDYNGVYDYKLKNAKSVFIPNPTITILGGNTPTGFSQAFPPESLGQGFMSRLLLVYGEPSGVKFTFPPPPDLELQAELLELLHRIKEEVRGELKMEDDAMELLDSIYNNWAGIDDPRFEHYANRRLTHLIKICLVITASRLGKAISRQDVITANTLLTFTEGLMPKALGEFGKSKNASVTHAVMGLINAAMVPITFQSIWKVVVQDLDKRDQLVEILSNLQVAEKIQSINGGYLPNKKIQVQAIKGSVDWSLLTQEERDIK